VTVYEVVKKELLRSRYMKLRVNAPCVVLAEFEQISADTIRIDAVHPLGVGKSRTCIEPRLDLRLRDDYSQQATGRYRRRLSYCTCVQ
jgi:hypothetical protein